MDWAEIKSALVLAIGGASSFTLLVLGLRVLHASKADYDQNRARSGTLLDVLKGKVRTKNNGVRDFRVRCGLAVNKHNQWEEQGALSEEAIDSVLARR